MWNIVPIGRRKRGKGRMVIRATNKVGNIVSSASPLMPQCWMILGLNPWLSRLRGIDSQAPNHSARSHPQYWRELIENLARSHPQLIRSLPPPRIDLINNLSWISSTTRLHLISNRLDLIHNLGYISSTLGYISSTTLGYISSSNRVHLIHIRLHHIHNLG